VELPLDLIRQVELQTGLRINSYTINFFGMRDPKHGDNIDIVDYLRSPE
jgi:Fur family ferric uptake transcriptional regulator